MLLERDGLLAELDSALAQAAAGSGRLLLVAGEAGSGKSSLLRVFASSLERGTVPTKSSCFNRVLERLTATLRPVVVLIEDIHWADEGTLDFLRFIGRRNAGTKSIVVATYRDNEVGADHPLRPVIGQTIPNATLHR